MVFERNQKIIVSIATVTQIKTPPIVGVPSLDFVQSSAKCYDPAGLDAYNRARMLAAAVNWFYRSEPREQRW